MTAVGVDACLLGARGSGAAGPDCAAGRGRGVEHHDRGQGWVSRQTVVSWRKRYVEGGLAALADADRPGRPRVHDEVAVVVGTLEQPPEHLGVTHWSTRLLADQLGMSFATVARIWRKRRLQPGGSRRSSSPPTPSSRPRSVTWSSSIWPRGTRPRWSGGEERGRAVPDVVVGRLGRHPGSTGSTGSTGAVRSRAWICWVGDGAPCSVSAV